MTVEGGAKHPLRKESNRRWAEGNDPSLIEEDEHDPTGKVFVRNVKQNYHRTKQPLPSEVQDWLKDVPLKRVGLRIDRNSLRKGRDGKPVAPITRKKLLLLFRITKRGVNLAEALNVMKLKAVVHRPQLR